LTTETFAAMLFIIAAAAAVLDSRNWHICDMARTESEGRIQPGSGHWLRERPMDAKARRKVIADMLAKLQRFQAR
jgi:hypothetical protein